MSTYWTLQHSPWFTESSRLRHTQKTNWKMQCFPWGTCSYGKVSARMGVCISLRSAPSLKSGGTANCSWWEPVFNDLNRKTIIMFIMVLSLQCIGEGNGTPLQYSCLENPMDGGAWQAAVRGVAKSQTRLSDFTFTFHFHALEKETATHSSVLAWRIPGMGKPGGLPSMGLYRVGHDWGDLAVTVYYL